MIKQLDSNSHGTFGVVVLTYNGQPLLERCLRSLAAQTLPPRHLWIVDNGSAAFNEDAVWKILGDQWRTWTTILRLEKNRGYAGGMNAGLSAVLDGVVQESCAGSIDVKSHENPIDWVMTLSNDATLRYDCVESIKNICNQPSFRQGSVGMLSPKVLNMNQPELLDAAGISVALDGMSTARGQGEVDTGQYPPSTKDVLLPNGVSAIYRREALLSVGLLDESFWAYCEDTDLGLRLWRAGWDCRYTPEAVVYHERSATLGEFSLNKVYLVERNHYWVAFKNFPLPYLIVLPWVSLVRYVLQVWGLVFGVGLAKSFRTVGSVPAHKLFLATFQGFIRALPKILEILFKRIFSVRYQVRPMRPYKEVLLTLWRLRLPLSRLLRLR